MGNAPLISFVYCVSKHKQMKSEVRLSILIRRLWFSVKSQKDKWFAKRSIDSGFQDDIITRKTAHCVLHIAQFCYIPPEIRNLSLKFLLPNKIINFNLISVTITVIWMNFSCNFVYM